MSPGDLRYSVEFQRSSVPARNGSGDPDRAWTTLYTDRCMIVSEGIAAADYAARQTALKTAVIAMRWNQRIMPGDRAIVNDGFVQTYYIVGTIRPMMGRREWMELDLEVAGTNEDYVYTPDFETATVSSIPVTMQTEEV